MSVSFLIFWRTSGFVLVSIKKKRFENITFKTMINIVKFLQQPRSKGKLLSFTKKRKILETIKSGVDDKDMLWRHHIKRI